MENLECEFNCQDSNSILKTFKDKLQIWKTTEPFKLMYGNINIKELDGYLLYHCLFYHNPEKFTYKPNDYYKYSDISSPKYSTPEIPVYLRPQRELIEMMQKDYYQTFEIDSYNAKNFNPTLYSSEICGRYIITPTIHPDSENAVIIAYNMKTGSYNTAYDFYKDPTFIFEMYKIFCNLNSDQNQSYLVYNSLEVGSLPEVYHFHIMRCNLKMPKNMKLISDDFYKVDGSTGPHANMYAVKLPRHGNHFDDVKKVLYRIPELLNELRYYHDTSTEEKYRFSSQIWFAFIENQEFLFISFRRINIKNIKVVNGNMVQGYFDDAFGRTLNDYNIIYGPVGLISYRDKHNKDFVLTPKIIKDMKAPFVYHPEFEMKIKEVFNTGYKFNYVTMTIPENTNPLCTNIDVDIEKSIYMPILGRTAYIECDSFPSLYVIGDLYLNNNNKKLIHGRTNLSGDHYYYIKTNANDIGTTNDLLLIAQKYDNTPYYPKYYTRVTTSDLTRERYFLFAPVKTNLNDFLELDQANLKHDSSIINAFIVIMVHYITELAIQNLRYDNPVINRIQVGDNDSGLIDYTFKPDLVISIAKNDKKFPINHYGHTLYFLYEDLKNGANATGDIKTFINSLHSKSSQLGITNLLLNELNNLVSNNKFSIDDVFEKLRWGMNIVEQRPGYYQILIFLNALLDLKIDPNNTNEIYKKIVSIVTNSKLNLSEYKKINVNKNQVFVTGTKLSNMVPIDFLSENKFKTDYPPTFFAMIDELENNSYLSNLAELYMETKNTSRIIFVSLIKDTSFIDFCEDSAISGKNLFNKLILLCNTLLNIKLVSNEIVTGSEMFTNDFIKKINDKIPNFIPDFYQNDNWGATLLFQDVFNLIFKIKFPDSAGHTCFIESDGSREFVFTNLSKFTKLNSVSILTDNGLVFYDNNYMFKEHMNKIKESTKVGVNSTKLISMIKENFEKIKKYQTRLAEQDFDFFTNPIIEGQLDFVINKVNILHGGQNKYYNKYRIYTNRYLKIKKSFQNR